MALVGIDALAAELAPDEADELDVGAAHSNLDALEEHVSIDVIAAELAPDEFEGQSDIHALAEELGSDVIVRRPEQKFLGAFCGDAYRGK